MREVRFLQRIRRTKVRNAEDLHHVLDQTVDIREYQTILQLVFDTMLLGAIFFYSAHIKNMSFCTNAITVCVNGPLSSNHTIAVIKKSPITGKGSNSICRVVSLENLLK